MRSRVRDVLTAVGVGGVYVVVSSVALGLMGDVVITMLVVNVLTAATVITWRHRRAAQEADNRVLELLGRRQAAYPAWIAIGGLTVLTVLLNVGSTWVALYVKALTSDQTFADATGASSAALLLALTLVFAPVAEEALVRGCVYPLVRRASGPGTAIVMTTALFAVLHGNLTQIVLTVPLGLVLGLVYERTHDLRYCVMVHVVFNVCAVLLPFSTDAVTGGQALVGCVLAAVSVLGVRLGTRSLSWHTV